MSFLSLIHRAKQHLPSLTILQVKKYIRYSFKHVTFINIEKRQEEWRRKTSVKFVLHHNFVMYDSSIDTPYLFIDRYTARNNYRPKKRLINYYNNKFYHIDLPLNLRTKWLISAFTSLVVWVLKFIHNYWYTFHIRDNKYLGKKGRQDIDRMFKFL